MTRTDNIKRNVIYNILKFAIQLVLQFVLRTVLIYTMGAEYLGLNGLFSNIFAFLNLAELGIGSAIVFSMYKPIAENDIEKVKALQSLYKKFYLIISFVVLSLGFLIMPFLNLFIKDGLTIDINLYALYSLYLINTLASYFCAHKRSLLFAYQRNDVENKIRTICIVIMTILQIFVLIVLKNYYAYYIVTVIFTIIESVFVYVFANKLFPELEGKVDGKLDCQTKKEITKNIVALSMHKVGGAVVFSTDSILISAFLGAVVLGAYSNYYLIITTLNTMFGLLTTAVAASVGNLIASQTKEYVYERYKIFNFIFVYLSAFTTICLFVLFQPFIEIWTGGGVYLLDNYTVIALCISYYISKMITGVSILKESAGLFYQDRWRPIIEALINLVSSIIFVKLFGIVGIVLGTILSSLVAPFIAGPHIVFKYYFNKKTGLFYKTFIVDFIKMLVVAVLCFYVCSFIPDGNIWLLVAKFAVCIVLSNILLILAYLPTKEFKELFNIGKNMLNKIFKKQNNKIVDEEN